MKKTKAKSVFMVVQANPGGDENVIGRTLVPDDDNGLIGIMVPLIASTEDPEQVQKIKDLAQDLSNQTKKKYKLIRFHNREEVEEIEPKIVDIIKKPKIELIH